MADCEQCGGAGWYPVLITVPVCCQRPTETGECCNQPIAGQEQQQEQCAACGGTGKQPTHEAAETNDGPGSITDLG